MHYHRAGFGSRLSLSFVSMLLVGVAACIVGETLAADAMGDSRRILVCGGRTAIVDITPDHPEGVVEWSWPAATREGWVLPDGNVLLALSKGASTPKGAAVEIKRAARTAVRMRSSGGMTAHRTR
jgi:hypothetical protein